MKEKIECLELEQLCGEYLCLEGDADAEYLECSAKCSAKYLECSAKRMEEAR